MVVFPHLQYLRTRFWSQRNGNGKSVRQCSLYDLRLVPYLLSAMGSLFRYGCIILAQRNFVYDRRRGLCLFFFFYKEKKKKKKKKKEKKKKKYFFLVFFFCLTKKKKKKKKKPPRLR